MFENRARGAQLAKNVSYFYIIVAVLVVIATLIIGVSAFILNAIFYIIMFAILYSIATRFKNHRYAWIFVALCGIVTLIWSLSFIGLVLAILLIVAANDMKKELDK